MCFHAIGKTNILHRNIFVAIVEGEKATYIITIYLILWNVGYYAILTVQLGTQTKLKGYSYNIIKWIVI